MKKISHLKEEIKAGIIVLTSLILLSVFVIFIGGTQVFEKLDTYTVKVMNAAGLEVGAQVKLGGVRIGRVIDIKPPQEPGEPVTIEIGIKRGMPLYKGTKASITQVGFVGDIYLLLSIDGTSHERIKAGEVIPSEELVQFTTLMRRLEGVSRSLDDLLKDIAKVFSPENMEEIQKLFGNTNKAVVSSASSIDKIALSLKRTTDKLELVLNEIEEIVRDNKGEISKAVKKAREDLDKAEEMIRAVEQTAKAVNSTAQSMDKAIDLQSRNLDDLLTMMMRTTEELKEVLQEIKNKPWSIIYKEERGREE